MEVKSTRGGKRAGAGKPKGEPYGTVSFRIPDHLREEFKVRVRELIKELKKTGS